MIKNVIVFAEPISEAIESMLDKISIIAPKVLIPEADKAMKLDGVLIEYLGEDYSIEISQKMNNDERRRYIVERVGSDWMLFSCDTGHIRYNVVVATQKANQYLNREWNFSLSFPMDWEVIFENNTVVGTPWTEALRIAGPKHLAARPFITIVTGLVKDDGKGLKAYMVKAENDLRGAFSDFRLLSNKEMTLLGFPAAEMRYTYRSDSGVRVELNLTAFFGKENMIWFQFICETNLDNESRDFPIFEAIINSLRVGSDGLRHPDVILAGKTKCDLCGRLLRPNEKCNAVVRINIGRLMGVCNHCWKAG